MSPASFPGEQSKVFTSAPKNLNYPGDPGCNNASGATTRYSNFGPRIGFAWAPDLGVLSGGSSRKLSLRAGYGIYYNRTEEETSLQNLEDPPFGVSSTGANDYATQANGITNPCFANPYQDLNTPGPAGTYTNKFPFVPPAAGTAPDFSNFLPFSLSQYAPGFRSPYSENVQLTLEREFPGQVVARASYVGTFGRHNQAVIEGNPITPAGHAALLGRFDLQRLTQPQHAELSVPELTPSTATPMWRTAASTTSPASVSSRRLLPRTTTRFSSALIRASPTGFRCRSATPTPTRSTTLPTSRTPDSVVHVAITSTSRA